MAKLKFYLVLIYVLIICPNSLMAFDFGHEVYGTVGPYGLGTKITLPSGIWKVAGSVTRNGGVRPLETILIQHEGKDIKAILNIKYVRGKGPTQGWDAVGGWKRTDHYDNNNCDDYGKQRSNYHYADIRKVKQNLILEGSCLAVFPRNDIPMMKNLATSTSLKDAFDMADNYISDKELRYPSALIVLGNSFFTSENQVHIYYMSNPEFNNTKSEKGIAFKASEWNASNIDNHLEKKDYMSNAITIARNVASKIDLVFQKKKTLNLTQYDDILTFNSLPVVSTTSKKGDIIIKLKKIKEMFDDGLISQKQYEIKSDDILKDL